MKTRHTLIAGLCSVFAAVGFTGAATDAVLAADISDDSPRSSFLLPVLPDTQFYSRYDANTTEGNQFRSRFGSEPFSTQTTWLVANRDLLEIPFVATVGDIVDIAAENKAEWPVASAAYGVLETAKLPYSILTGNHDVLDSGKTDAQRVLANEPYLKTFPANRAAAQATFGGRDATGLNEWHTFTAEGHEFLVLALAWSPSDATLTWANKVIADHPSYPVILTSHDGLNIAGDAVSPMETDFGKRLWDKLIRKNDQIFLTFNGHYHGVSHLRKVNDFGHSVDEIVIDYQMAYMGGNGYLGLYELDFTNDRIASTVVSPWVPTKPKATLIPEFDQAIRTGPMQQLDLPIDWDSRFAGFAVPKAPPVATHGSLIAAAEQQILSGYTEPTPPVNAPAHDAEDYPHVEGTLAHWRFAEPDGTTGAIGAGETIADVAGDNPITRAPLSSGNGQLQDLSRSSDHAYLSSDPGSACFTNTTKSPLRASYLNTAADAPVNAETFPNGYTIETFVKIDPKWTGGTNAWMGALTREGKHGDGVNQGDPDDPLFTLAISNLREVQWNAVTSAPALDGQTAWSGEVMPSTWLHIAAVNDPETKTTTLYVNGAPVLRNAKGGVGMATANKPWRIGTAMYGAVTDDGWLGCVGETRIVDHPLAATEWLTARTYTAPTQPTTPAAGGSSNPTQTTTTPTTAPSASPAAPSPPSAAAPVPTKTTAPAPTTAAKRLAISGLRLRGRALSLRLSDAAKVRVTLTRCEQGEHCAAKPARTLTTSVRTAGAVTVKVPAAVHAGRYRVEITATAGGRTAHRSAIVQVARR
jgi:hypothetical protein